MPHGICRAQLEIGLSSGFKNEVLDEAGEQQVAHGCLKDRQDTPAFFAESMPGGLVIMFYTDLGV